MPKTKFSDVVTVIEVRIEPMECGECGVLFGMSSDFIAQRRRDGNVWYCPNGHPRVYNGGKSRDEVLRAEAEQRLAAEKGWSRSLEASLEAERKSHSSTKGQLTKARKKVQGGVCPVADCHRHFANLEQHMASKHPADVNGLLAT